MKNIRDIKRRIKSVQSTQQITKAMEMVAAAKLRKAQQRVEAARPYSEHLNALMRRIVSADDGNGNLTHPLLVSNRDSERESESRQNESGHGKDGENERTLLVLFTADRGLCGSFNANLIREAEAFLGKIPVENALIYFAGKKGAEHFSRRNWKIAGDAGSLEGGINQRAVKRAMNEIISFYTRGEVDRVVFLYSRFQTAMTHVITLRNYLPIEPGSETAEQVENDSVDYIIEPDAQGLLDAVIPRYCHTIFLQSVLETFASEQGARMISMGSATKNAGEMIEHLTLLRNKARQAGITREISEIVGGAEALKG